MEARRLLALVGVDPNFGAGGAAPQGGSLLLTTLPDGKILAAGEGHDRGAYRVSRLNRDGTVDRSFKDAFADGATGSGAVLSGSRVVVLARPGFELQFELRAINLADGSADDSFGDSGVATFNPKSVLPLFTLYSYAVTSMTATSDGGVLIGMYQFIRRNAAPHDSTTRDVLYKFDAQGRPDPGFGDHGGLVPPEVGRNQEDGYPYLTGHPEGGFLVVNEGTLTRHHEDGTIDESFGDAGEVSLGIIPTHASFPSWNEAHVQPDGKILIPVTSNPDFGGAGYLGRLNADGSLDTSFGTNGVADIVASHTIWDVALDSSGRILGFVGPDLFRLTPDGKADASFDDDGIFLLESAEQLSEIAVDDSGGVLVGDFTTVVRLVARDRIVLGRDGAVHVDGTDGNDTIVAARAGDQISVSLNGQSVGFAAADVSKFVIDTRLGSDSVDVAVDLDAVVDTHGGGGSFVRTASGNDIITGSPGRDTILAGAGDDHVIGGGSSNTVDGGAGHDTIFGGGGDDELVGGDGDDKIYGEEGNDAITGGAGGDWLYGDAPFGPFFGSGGADSIAGGDGNDWLYGDEHHNDGANDTLDGGAGENVLNSTHVGGITISGNLLRFDGTDGADDISIWRDTIDSYIISVDGAQEAIDLRALQEVQFTGHGGDDFLRLNPRLWWAATMEGGAGDDTLMGASAADDLRGGDGDDELQGHGGNDALDGGLGADFIRGHDGRDQVDYSSRTGNLNVTVNFVTVGDGEAGEGDLVYPDVERVLGGAGNDVLTGGSGANMFYGSDGDDTLFGGPGADRLFGEGGNDRINGADGDDYIESGAGQDSLHGDAGADALFGLAGNDRLFSGGDDARDTVRGGAGFDLAHFDELDDVLATELAI